MNHPELLGSSAWSSASGGLAAASPQLELYLAGTGSLPAPFGVIADPTLWTLDGDTLLLAAADLTAVPSL